MGRGSARGGARARHHPSRFEPANIKVRDDGVVKVLDSGLAKAMVRPAAEPRLMDSPTITSPVHIDRRRHAAGHGRVYMSPEQAKGRAADKRSDVWAFGAVLYELLAGRRAFPGDDLAETLAAVTARSGAGVRSPKSRGRRRPGADRGELMARNAGNFTLSRQGTLAYVPAGGGTSRSVTWVSRTGRLDPVPLPERTYASVRLSPDESSLAFSAGAFGIWTWEIASGALRRVAFESTSTNPMWSPDRRWVVFSWGPVQARTIARHAADGRRDAGNHDGRAEPPAGLDLARREDARVRGVFARHGVQTCLPCQLTARVRRGCC